MMTRVCDTHPKTKFLVYTKRYEFDLEHACANLSVIYSRWPGLPFPDTLAHKAQAHYEDDKTTTLEREGASPCPGSCAQCKKCWALATGNSNKGHVLFHAH